MHCFPFMCTSLTVHCAEASTIVENLSVEQQMAHCVTFIIITPASAVLTHICIYCVFASTNMYKACTVYAPVVATKDEGLFSIKTSKYTHKNRDILAEKSWHLPCRSLLFIDSERQYSFSLGISALRPAFVFYRHSAVFSTCPHFQSSCLAFCKRLVFR